MNNNQKRKAIFKKMREYKNTICVCENYNCNIFKNCMVEIERLNHLLEDIKTHLESYDYDNMPLDARVLATNISLIIDGTIKVVR